jgi:hypothetical protein
MSQQVAQGVYKETIKTREEGIADSTAKETHKSGLDYLCSIALATRTKRCPVRDAHFGKSKKKKRTEYLVPISSLVRDVEFANTRAQDIDAGHANELADEFEVDGQNLGACVHVAWDASEKYWKCCVLWGSHRYEAAVVLETKEIPMANLPRAHKGTLGLIWVSHYDISETPVSLISTLLVLENDLHPTSRRNSKADRVNGMKQVWLDRKDEILLKTNKLAKDCTDKEKEDHFMSLVEESLPKSTLQKRQDIWEAIKLDPAAGASKTKSYTKSSAAKEFTTKNPYWTKGEIGGRTVGAASRKEFTLNGDKINIQGWFAVGGTEKGATIQQVALARNINNKADYTILISSPHIPADSSQQKIEEIREKEATERIQYLNQNIGGVYTEDGCVVDEVIYIPASEKERKENVAGYAVRYARNPKTNKIEQVPVDNTDTFPFLR